MNISFVIPAYNESALISHCIAAIQKEIERNKERINAEIIVVDNASTDNTEDIACAAGATVIYEPQKGIVHARAAGAHAARYELIANIDADTRITEGWLAAVEKNFVQNPSLVVLSGPTFFYDVPPYINYAVKIFYALTYIIYFFNKFIFRNGSVVQGGNFVIMKSALIAAGGFDTSIEFYGEDADIARRLFPIGDVVFTNDLCAYSSPRRFNGEGLVQTGLRYWINYIWIIFFKKSFSVHHKDFR